MTSLWRAFLKTLGLAHVRASTRALITCLESIDEVWDASSVQLTHARSGTDLWILNGAIALSCWASGAKFSLYERSLVWAAVKVAQHNILERGCNHRPTPQSISTKM